MEVCPKFLKFKLPNISVYQNLGCVYNIVLQRKTKEIKRALKLTQCKYVQAKATISEKLSLLEKQCCFFLIEKQSEKLTNGIIKNHSILLQNPEYYGFRGNVLNLFSSYLLNRQQYVSVNNVNSSTQYIKYGVPQGPVLGPILFLLYINDVGNSCDSTPRLFADDTCVIAKGTSPAQLEQQLNHELKQIVAWINANDLTINPSKTYALVISPFTNLNSSILDLFYNHHRFDVVGTVKYLGIILDNQLLFKQHIKMLEFKLSHYVGILFKLISFLPKYISSKIYYAFIHENSKKPNQSFIPFFRTLRTQRTIEFTVEAQRLVTSSLMT